VPNARAFAKTDWLCRTVRERTGIEVARIEPSLDRELHNGLHVRPVSRPVPITAMVRPSSGRRNPRGTLSVLREVRRRHGSAVDIRVFGCSDEELDSLGEVRAFRFVNWGELKRWEVADVLRGAGIFVDLSSYQAFGATGLEAMAAGCATVLPRGSGAEEYARDAENCLLVDTASEADAVAAIGRLITDTDLMARIRAEALRTARQYSVGRCVWSLLCLFGQSLGRGTAGRGATVAG
jgi:glycosyltransferase involved in cell wall biosynthesis